jgi:tyrosyl-tRNA synthetase
MAYLHMLSDLGMNYTLNRALNDGKATARIEETRAVASQIKDFDT